MIPDLAWKVLAFITMAIGLSIIVDVIREWCGKKRIPWYVDTDADEAGEFPCAQGKGEEEP